MTTYTNHKNDLLNSWKTEFRAAVKAFERHHDGDGYDFNEGLSYDHPSYFNNDTRGMIRAYSNTLVGYPEAYAEEMIQAYADALLDYNEWEADQA